jgi:hypothetical protein
MSSNHEKGITSNGLQARTQISGVPLYCPGRSCWEKTCDGIDGFLYTLLDAVVSTVGEGGEPGKVVGSEGS